MHRPCTAVHAGPRPEHRHDDDGRERLDAGPHAPPVAELDEQVRELAAQGKKINYTVFAGGNHMYTWSFAYGIDAIRDWLFAQKK